MKNKNFVNEKASYISFYTNQDLKSNYMRGTMQKA
jgi:hypothetical protein